MIGPILSSVGSLLPWHILSYGTLLGTSLYQSWVMTKLCYISLPAPQFQNLQKRVFPVYFRLTVALSVLTAATLPNKSVAGLKERPYDAIPLGLMVAMGTLNWLVYGPKTTAAMESRTAQAAQEGRRAPDSQGVSDAMKKVKRQFSRNHAMSIHLNFIFMIATVAYGFMFASRLEVK